MIIDVFSLRQKGVLEKQLEFSYSPPDNLLSIPDACFLNPATIKALVEIYPDEVYISGTVCVTVKAPCSRCLKDCTQTITAEFDDRFLPDSRSNEEEDKYLIYSRDKINLTGYINQLILTEMPLSILCSPDCLGLCPVCGQDLNLGDCGHHK